MATSSRKLSGWAPLVWCAALGVHAGCTRGGDDHPPGGAGNQEIGGFLIRLVPARAATPDVPAAPAHTALLGLVQSGPTPSSLEWRPIGAEGGCRVVQPRAPFCDPPCSASSVCVGEGQCSAHPLPRNAGTVQVRGLRAPAGATELTIPPMPPRFLYQLPADVELAYPPFAAGADVEISASGGELGAFRLAARGITPLELAGEPTLTVEGGRPVLLRWTPASAGEPTTIEISLDLSSHGGTKGKLQCTATDDGSFEIPAGLITQLIALGTAGFPSIMVTRSSSSQPAALAAGRVSLRISSEISRPVAVPGDISCLDQSECPPGTTCTAARLCK